MPVRSQRIARRRSRRPAWLAAGRGCRARRHRRRSQPADHQDGKTARSHPFRAQPARPCGRRFSARASCRRLTGGFETLDQAVASARRRDETILTHLALRRFSRHAGWFTGWIDFTEKHPDIRLRIDATTARANLEGSPAFDVGILVVGSGNWPWASGPELLLEQERPSGLLAGHCRKTEGAEGHSRYSGGHRRPLDVQLGDLAPRGRPCRKADDRTPRFQRRLALPGCRRLPA